MNAPITLACKVQDSFYGISKTAANEPLLKRVRFRDDGRNDYDNIALFSKKQAAVKRDRGAEGADVVLDLTFCLKNCKN